MPTQHEQVAMVESALRQRFFPLVAKIETPERVNWSEEQHDIDRLSRALAAYALVGACEIEDAVAASALTDGSGDGGIDSCHYDRTGNRLLLVQSKFKREGAGPCQADGLKTINGIKALMARRFEEFNDQFQLRADEIEEALDNPGIILELVIVFPGQTLNQHVTNDLNALEAELNEFDASFRWGMKGLTDLHDWLVAEQTPSAVELDVILENWNSITSPRKAVYGQVSAAALAELVEMHGTGLFEKNLRHYLGSVGVNAAIEQTVRRQPDDFFYLNNGLTAVAETIKKSAGGKDKCNFHLANVSIVNGAQTAGAVAAAALSHKISLNAKLMITIIEIESDPDDIGLRITKARNHQNVVRGADFAALDPQQERLRRELAACGITYHYRPSAEARTRREDAFTLEEATLALACLSFPILSSAEVEQLRIYHRKILNAVDYVVTAKNEIGRLWDPQGGMFKSIFNTTLSGIRVCRLVSIHNYIDQILAATERSEETYSRRMFFRHGRYFIMAFVAHRSSEVMTCADYQLSEADRTLLSQQANALAELIYVESSPLQGSKGYLSVFRNLTDVQPLADAVLRRLAEQDAQRLAEAAAAAALPDTAITE